MVTAAAAGVAVMQTHALLAFRRKIRISEFDGTNFIIIYEYLKFVQYRRHGWPFGMRSQIEGRVF